MPRESLKDEPMLASLHRLSRDGRSWIAAEAAFAQAEVASDGRRIGILLALSALVFGCLFSSVILLSLFVVVLLSPYVNGLGNAAGILALILLVVALVAGFRVRTLASREFGLLAVLKRWWSMAAKGPGAENATK